MNATSDHGRRVAIYARVSTSDKEQNVETQLLPLRDFCLAQGWEVYREYVDQAPANDLAHRVQWLRDEEAGDGAGLAEEVSFNNPSLT